VLFDSTLIQSSTPSLAYRSRDPRIATDNHRFIQVQVVHPFPSAQKNTQCPSRESYAKGCTFTRLRVGMVLLKSSPQTLASIDSESFAKKGVRSRGSKQNTPESPADPNLRLTKDIFRRGGEHIRQGVPKDVCAARFFNRAVCVFPRATRDQNRDKHDRAPEVIHVSSV
jgi:hypothetical protein